MPYDARRIGDEEQAYSSISQPSGQKSNGRTSSVPAFSQSQIASAVIGIAVYVAFSGAVEQGLATMFAPTDWAVMIALVLAMLALALAGAWGSASLLGLPRADRIAFVFAGSQKSVAIGAPLAAILFPPASAGFVIAPLLLYHLAQLVLAAPLALRLAKTAEA